jgi:hypothetical protein
MGLREILNEVLPCIYRSNGSHDWACSNCTTRKRILAAVKHEKFQKGDRVMLTDAALRAGIRSAKRSKTGVVTGFGRDESLIRVRMDGNKQTQSFHQSFFFVTTRNI